MIGCILQDSSVVRVAATAAYLAIIVLCLLIALSVIRNMP